MWSFSRYAVTLSAHVIVEKKASCGCRRSFGEETCLSFRVCSHYVSCVCPEELAIQRSPSSLIYSHVVMEAQLWVRSHSGNFVVNVIISAVCKLCVVSRCKEWSNDDNLFHVLSPFSGPSECACSCKRVHADVTMESPSFWQNKRDPARIRSSCQGWKNSPSGEWFCCDFILFFLQVNELLESFLRSPLSWDVHQLRLVKDNTCFLWRSGKNCCSCSVTGQCNSQACFFASDSIYFCTSPTDRWLALREKGQNSASAGVEP